ncbi:MAG TPA: universal stress protein [Polyangiaceae bacterium]|jgi:nucleotide-binding universal stress UspA family protein|nr:universal stress protein [Polyangiaceae bacterium]
MGSEKDVESAESAAEEQTAVIIAAVDTSPKASLVIETAARLARRNWGQAQLNILHVYKTGLLDRPPPGGGHANELKEEARNYLDHHVRMARRQTTVPVSGQLAVGDPADEIVRAADSLSADLIVLSTHDSSGLERLLLGSVAEAVVRRARCAVLVVRPKERAPKRA